MPCPAPSRAPSGVTGSAGVGQESRRSRLPMEPPSYLVRVRARARDRARVRARG